MRSSSTRSSSAARNLIREGRLHATGQVLNDAPARKGDGRSARADALVGAIRQGHPVRFRRGRGIAIAIKAVTSPTTSVAIVNVSADGSVTLYCGTVDMGQGSDTAMAQMVGEVLDIPAEAVRVIPRDTDVNALRHGHARLALAVPHGARGAARGGGGQEKLKALARRSASRKAPISRSPSCSRSVTACRPAMSSGPASSNRTMFRPTPVRGRART